MSEFEYDPTREAWEAAFEADPVGASAQLAEAYAAQYAQHQTDPGLIAAQAASMVDEVNAQRAHLAAGQQFATMLDRSMVAEYGQEYIRRTPQLATRLAGDEEFARIADSGDASRALQHMDKVYRELTQDTNPDAAEWAKIRESAPKNYWE